MDLSRIKHLRGELEAERLSWGEVAEIESAFYDIDPTTLPEPAENAGWSDMLDELEIEAGSLEGCPDCGRDTVTHTETLGTAYCTHRGCGWRA